MTNEEVIFPVLKKFNTMIEQEDFLIDKSGVKIVEQIAVQMELDPMQTILDFGVKKTNEDYVQKELNWYLSQDLNIKGWVDDISIWKQVCDKDGFVNSNYGWCVFSKENYSQYEYALNELLTSPQSRKASMIYTRPSMTEDWNKNGRSDTICTMYVQCYIRNSKLVYVLHQRSCDQYFGFFNDLAWAQYVYKKLIDDLNSNGQKVLPGKIIYNIDSLHVYERHFKLTKKIIDNY